MFLPAADRYMVTSFFRQLHVMAGTRNDSRRLANSCRLARPLSPSNALHFSRAAFSLLDTFPYLALINRYPDALDWPTLAHVASTCDGNQRPAIASHLGLRWCCQQSPELHPSFRHG